jgi:hypothetical protein
MALTYGHLPAIVTTISSNTHMFIFDTRQNILLIENKNRKIKSNYYSHLGDAIPAGHTYIGACAGKRVMDGVC